MTKKTTMVDPHPLKHVAIIMDGNNRWANQRGLSGKAGHQAGAERIRDVLRGAQKAGVEVVTLFAFSSENWRRPATEVRHLMSLFSSYLKKEARSLREEGVRLRVVGDRSRLSDRIKSQLQEAEKITANGKLTLVLCVDYGGRWDIATAARQLAGDVQQGRVRLGDIDEDLFAGYLCLSDLPDVDLCVRTAGEQRVSNFVLWQLAYAELYFSKCFWPDFDESAFQQAVDEYHRRQRRFGGRLENKPEQSEEAVDA